MAEESSLTIGEVACRAGVRASALRYYESVGLLEAPRRAAGRRAYSPDVLDMLRVIRLAQDAGECGQLAECVRPRPVRIARVTRER